MGLPALTSWVRKNPGTVCLIYRLSGNIMAPNVIIAVVTGYNLCDETQELPDAGNYRL